MERSIISWTPRAARLCAAGLVAGIVLSLSTPARTADSPKSTASSASAAMEILTQKGLTKLKPTTTSVPWVLADEAKVHEKLETFRKADAAHRDAAKKVHTDSVTTAKDREVLSKAEKIYQEYRPYYEKPETIPPQIRRKFRTEQEMKQALVEGLNDAVSTINRLRPKVNGQTAGSMPPSLKAAIIDWMTVRNNLILAYVAVEPEFSELNRTYQELAKDTDVAAALKTLGKKNRLGSKDFEQDQKAMAAAEATALSGEVPFYRDGLFDYMGGLLNETTPVVVRIETVNAQSGNWAPAELLVKAGITIDASTPTVTLTFTGNGKRTIPCRQVIVPKFRLGKYVLENLKFLAMPDEAKDLGTQLVSKELNGFDLTPDVEKWLFKLVKKEQPKPDDKDAKPDAETKPNP